MSNHVFNRAYEDAKKGKPLGNTSGMSWQAKESAEAGSKAGQKK